MALPAQPEACWQDGCIHDGAGSAIADNAGGRAARTLCGEGSEVLTVEIKINSIAPAVGDHIEAIDTVLKSGRTVTVCRQEARRSGDGERTLVATGQRTRIRVTAPAH
ncbi:PaaI family thioesterase [Streptomyces sp. NPDC008238]